MAQERRTKPPSGEVCEIKVISPEEIKKVWEEAWALYLKEIEPIEKRRNCVI
jgi:hypothetical protein